MSKDMRKIYHNLAELEKKKQKKQNKMKEAEPETSSFTKNKNS
jgi:hypothetical protein